jgi:hypothetical protein
MAARHQLAPSTLDKRSRDKFVEAFSLRQQFAT